MARSPDDMTAIQRIEEVADILSEGLLRLKAKHTKKNRRLRDILLDSSPDQSVHAATISEGDSA